MPATGQLASLVAIKEDADLDLTEIKSLLQRVAKSIHEQPNRVKYVMMLIGGRSHRRS